MENERIAATVRSFLARSFDGRALGDDDDIFAVGFGNSLFAMQLVSFVEQEHGITIGGEDLDMDNFRSVRAITDLVARKLGAPAAG